MGETSHHEGHARYRGPQSRVECFAREHEVTCVIYLDQVVFALFVDSVSWQSRKKHLTIQRSCKKLHRYGSDVIVTICYTSLNLVMADTPVSPTHPLPHSSAGRGASRTEEAPQLSAPRNAPWSFKNSIDLLTTSPILSTRITLHFNHLRRISI